MDSTQKLLAVVIVSLTTLLVVVGFQVVMILLDLRKALRRLNSLLDDSILGGGLLRPEKLTGIMELFKRGRKMTSHGEDPKSALKD